MYFSSPDYPAYIPCLYTLPPSLPTQQITPGTNRDWGIYFTSDKHYLELKIFGLLKYLYMTDIIFHAGIVSFHGFKTDDVALPCVTHVHVYTYI